MKKFLTQSICLLIALAGFVGMSYAQFPTIYASVASGSYNSAATWETFTGNATNTPGAQGTGTPAVSTPSGTHFVYIRTGHTITMNGGNRSCYGMLVENGGKIWANEAAARRLQVVNGGTGFLYPQTGTITNNGVMGGVGDGLFFETGTNCQNVTFTGTGSTIVQRLRVPGGFGSTAGGIVNITIDMNITFTIANNYALSLVYNPQATDNYFLTINPGVTVTISDPGGYFNNNSLGSGAAFGNYSYLINGTLDLSASTQTSQFLTAISPTGGNVTVTVGSGGVIKTGAAFNSSPVAPGVGNINLLGGSTIDARLATVMNFNENSITAQVNTGVLRRSLPNDGTRTRFPLSPVNGRVNHVVVSNVTGPADEITATIQSGASHPIPTGTMPVEWSLTEATTGGNADTLRFEWTTTDEANGFSSASPVFVGRWDGSAWSFAPATVSGTGTTADPFVAKSSITYSSLGLFVLSNTNTTPVSFVNVRAYQKQGGIQVEFANAIEEDVQGYVIEKSTDGRTFTDAATLQPRSNNGTLSSYSWFDAAATSVTYFFRIRAIERNGQVKFSQVLSVRLSASGAGITVYPNPVRNGQAGVQLMNLDRGTYAVSLLNEAGQKVYAKSVMHNGGTATISLELPASLRRGVYHVQVSDANNRYIQKIVVE